jgi:hypothetical protein
MTNEQADKTIVGIVKASDKIMSLMEKFAKEGDDSAFSCLVVFEEIMKSWFGNDVKRLKELSDFVTYGGDPENLQAMMTGSLRDLIFARGPETNH